MADIQVSNAPFIQKWFYVTGAFGEERSGGRIHKGLDLAPAGYSGSLYAIDDFTIQYVGFDGNGYGNYFIANNGNGMMYLYAHMASIPPAVGTHIPLHGYIGEAGMTGSTTGVHLHLEMQAGSTWTFNAPLSTYTDPTSYLTDINNVATYNDRYYFNGSPTPPPPPPSTREHHFPWFIYQNNNFD